MPWFKTGPWLQSQIHMTGGGGAQKVEGSGGLARLARNGVNDDWYRIGMPGVNPSRNLAGGCCQIRLLRVGSLGTYLMYLCLYANGSRRQICLGLVSCR